MSWSAGGTRGEAPLGPPYEVVAGREQRELGGAHMSARMRRNWWRAVAAAVVGGVAVAGWGRADSPAKDKDAPADAKKDDAVWTRSAKPLPTPEPPLARPVVPAGGVVPSGGVAPPGAVVPAGAVAPAPSSPLQIVTVPVVVQPPPTTPMPGLPVPSVPDFRPTTPTGPEVPTFPRVESPVPLPGSVQVAPPAPPAKSAGVVQPTTPARPDFNLRPADGGNSVKPEAPAVPQPPAFAPIPTAPAAVPGLPGVRPKPPDLPTAPTVKDVYGAPAAAAPPPVPQPTTLTIPAPGADPMFAASNPSVVAAVTGIALAFAPATPAASAQDKTDPAQLRKDLDASNKRLEAAEAEIKRLSALLDGKRDERGFRLESDPGATEEVRRLKDRVRALETQLDAMRNSTSLRPPTGGVGPAAVAGRGTVRVVNEYPVVVSIVVNDKSYRVDPGATLNVDVPAGEFTYQLLASGIGATPTRSAIKDKEVVTLRVK